MAATTEREHRLAAGYAIFIPSSLAFGLLLAGRHPAFLAAGFGAGPGLCRPGSPPCAALACRGRPWHRRLGSRVRLPPAPVLAFHARRGRLPVIPMLALQLVPILLLAGYWITLSLQILLAR